MVESAVHIPLDELRARLGELDKTKPTYLYCASGLRSYLACRLLTQNGFDCYTLAGGFNLYANIVKAKQKNEEKTN